MSCIGPYGGLSKVVRIIFFIQYFLSDGPLFSYNVFLLLFKLLLNPAQRYNTNVTWQCMILHCNKLQIHSITLHYELNDKVTTVESR